MNLPTKVDDKLVVVDTETGGLFPDDGSRISTVSIAYRTDGELVVQAWPFDQGFLNKSNVQPTLFAEDDVNLLPEDLAQLIEWLSTQRLIGHNLMFDIVHLAAGHRLRGHTPRQICNQLVDAMHWDTMLYEWVWSPELGKSLEAVGERREVPVPKLTASLAAHKTKGDNPRYDLMPWSVIGPYASNDAELTLRIFEEQVEESIESSVHWRLFDREMIKVKMLTHSEIVGIGWDIDAARYQADIGDMLISKLTLQLPFRPTSFEASKYFFVSGRYPAHCMTEKGAPSARVCCIGSVAATGDTDAKIYRRLMMIKRQVGTYFTGWSDLAGEDERLRIRWRQTGTKSYRFSCERINMMAIPQSYRLTDTSLRPVRSMFRAKTDRLVLVEADLSQAELRVGAHIAGCQTMLDSIAAGDPHGDTARALFGITEGDSDWPRKRHLAKTGNFGLAYGAGPPTFKAILERDDVWLPMDECEQLVKQWRELYWEFPLANDKYERLVAQLGYAQSIVTGRPRPLHRDEDPRKGFNQTVQSSIADHMGSAMILLEQHFPRAFRLQIHDSLVIEIPKTLLERELSAFVDEWGQLATEELGTPMKVDFGPFVEASS